MFVHFIHDMQGMHEDLPSVITDVIGIFDAETSSGLGDNSAQDERAVFRDIAKETEKFLSDKLIKERLEIDTLQEIKTVQNNTFYTRFIKVKTKL